MTSKLIQLLSGNYKTLFKVPSDTTEEEIRDYWFKFNYHNASVDEDYTFEDYMDEFYPDANFERQFVDEIYLDFVNKCYLCKETKDDGAKSLVEGERYVCTNCLTNR